MKIRPHPALLFLLLPGAISAQGLGTIVGTVIDPQGASVPSAAVNLKQVGTGLERSTTTNAQGYFVLPSLLPSHYEMEVIASGFRAYSQKNITLQADQTLTINARLVVGASQLKCYGIGRTTTS